MSDTFTITLLGTGIPHPQEDASGTATLIEAGGQRILIDCGRGTVVRLHQLGIPIGTINKVIFSHYHSDHYSGLPDFFMSGALQVEFGGRSRPLHIFGPPGIDSIARGLELFAEPDRDIRVADGEITPELMTIVPQIYNEGVIHDEGGLRILAIEVDHGEYIKPAYAFRVEFGGRVFVHSHDTRYSRNLVEHAIDADVLVHELAAARPETLAQSEKVQIVLDHHSKPSDVARVFNEVRPRLALLTHLVLLGPNPVSVEEVLEEVARDYDGTVLVAEDMMSIKIGNAIGIMPYHSGGTLLRRVHKVTAGV